MIFHIVKKAEWLEALRRGTYEPESLKAEGFVHCSTFEQAAQTANRFFRGQSDLVLLCIEPQRLRADLRLERPANPSDERVNQLFPHVYGPINLDAVRKALDFPCDLDGSFQLPPGL